MPPKQFTEKQMKEMMRDVIRQELGNFVGGDRYVFQRHLQLLDGKNIQLAKGVGTKIGTEATQKLGFYGTTPVAQQTGVAVSSAGIHAALVSLGLITA